MDNTHYMSIKRRSKMTMGRLRAWHLMLLVVCKLQPMCLFTKKVTSACDNEKKLFTSITSSTVALEVIDIPRTSPVLRTNTRLSRQTAHTDSDTMPTEHHEELPPMISPPTSPFQRVQRDDEQDRAKRFMEKFKTDRSTKLLESKCQRVTSCRLRLISIREKKRRVDNERQFYVHSLEKSSSSSSASC